ncbi:MAG: dioxygenase [Hyphomicrobiales bacterium]|nr:dioxygenase [Hyphomicrobiales bacterium]
MSSFPSIFVSHGSPMLAIEDGPARRFLGTLGIKLGRPRAILVASAHWLTAAPTVSLAKTPRTIHDFGRFSDDLFALSYKAPGAPPIAQAALHLLNEAGIPARAHPDRGLDHGAWVPLRLMYPDADIPIAQISIQPDAGPAHHFRIGRALGPLRDEDVLILGSGGITHNLNAFFTSPTTTRTPEWVETFATWISEALAEGRIEDLLEYRRQAPFAVENHPTDEHLLPLFMALGAGGDEGGAQQLHSSFEAGVLAMDAYAFNASGLG